MSFEEFLNSYDGKEVGEERLKRAVWIQGALKEKFGLDVTVLPGDSPIEGYVLVKIEGKSEKIVPVDIPITSPVKERTELLNIEELEKKYNELVKGDYPIVPYISMEKLGIVASFGSKRVLYFIKTKGEFKAK